MCPSVPILTPPNSQRSPRRQSSTDRPPPLSPSQLEDRPDCDDIQDALLEITGGRSVPRVFVGGEFIGGGDDTARKAGNGELEALLKAVGAM
jgi:glutaredoxin 3